MYLQINNSFQIFSYYVKSAIYRAANPTHLKNHQLKTCSFRSYKLKRKWVAISLNLYIQHHRWQAFLYFGVWKWRDVLDIEGLNWGRVMSGLDMLPGLTRMVVPGAIWGGRGGRSLARYVIWLLLVAQWEGLYSMENSSSSMTCISSEARGSNFIRSSTMGFSRTVLSWVFSRSSFSSAVNVRSTYTRPPRP
jgi:hypothetical protein